MTRGRLPTQAWILFPLLVALALAVPLVVSEYAFHDDWTFLEGATGEGLGSALTSSLAQGRPLFVLVSVASWSGVDSIADLARLRGLGALGTLVLGLAVGRWLRGLGHGTPVAAAAAGGAVVLAPTVLFAAWAVLWPGPWIAAAAFAVGARIDRRARADGPPSAVRGAAAIDLVLLVALFLAYPPAAFAVLVPPVLGPLAERREGGGGGLFRGPIVTIAVLAAAAPLVALAQWAARRLVAPKLPASDRMQLLPLDELPGRFVWLLREPLARALDLPASGTRLAVALVVATAAVVGLGLVARRRDLRPAGVAATVAAGLVLTSAAAWLPADRHLSYRTLAAPALLAWLLFVLSAREVADRVAGRRRGGAVAGALLAAWTVTVGARMVLGFVAPLVDTHRQELAILRQEARRIVAERPRRVEIRRIDWRTARRPGRHGEWNAFPSAADHWYAGAMIRIVTREAGAEFGGEVVVVDAPAAGEPASGPSTLRVDYADRFERRQDGPAAP